MDKNLPASAGDTGLILGLGKFHMPWSNWARVPQLLKPARSSARKPELVSASAASAEARVPEAWAVQQEKQDSEKPVRRS